MVETGAPLSELEEPCMPVDHSAAPTPIGRDDRLGCPRSTRAVVLGAAVAVGALLAGCGSTAATTTAPSTTAAPAASTTTAGGTSGTAVAPSVEKVSANTASAAEIQKALEAAGVTNAARWTKEVIEYRPYAADDVNLSSLKKNLVKYNPSPETLNAILSALKP
jgi:hypothetical protein